MSRTNIYRANSPTIYARVMILNFIAYIVKHNLWESFHYIFNHAIHNKYEMHERQTLKNKPILSRKPFPLKPSKLLPHWQQVPKWITRLEGQYSMSSYTRCALLVIWVKSHAHIQWRTLGGNQTILRIKDC